MRRRKFLKAGLLWLPSVALGQSVNAIKWRQPETGQGQNWIAADFFSFSTNNGIGWSEDGTFETVSGNSASPSKNLTTNEETAAGYLFGQQSRWKRQLQILNNWTQIRIGLISWVTAAAGITDYGILCGMVNHSHFAFDGSSSNFVGSFHGTGGGAWTFNANAGNSFILAASSDSYACTNISGVNNFVTYGAATGPNFMTSASQHRNLQFTEITKGTPNYTVASWAVRNAGDAIQDMTLADLNTGLGLASGADMTISGRTLTLKSTTLAMSEAAGNLDSVNISLGGATAGFPSTLFAVAVRKIA